MKYRVPTAAAGALAMFFIGAYSIGEWQRVALATTETVEWQPNLILLDRSSSGSAQPGRGNPYVSVPPSEPGPVAGVTVRLVHQGIGMFGCFPPPPPPERVLAAETRTSGANSP